MKHSVFKVGIALGAVVALALITAPREARAQAAPSPAVKKEAVKLDRQAYKAWQAGNLKGALELWLKAYTKWPKPLLLYNVALAYEQLKDTVRAVSYLREYLRVITKGGGKAAIAAQATARLKILGKKVAVLRVKGPAGSMVHIDGKPVGAVPVEVVILPGSHKILLTKGRQPVGRQTVTLAAGQSETVTVLAPVPIAPPPRKRRVGAGGSTDPGGGVTPTPRAEKPKGLPMTYALTFAVVAVALAGAATGTGIKALQLNKEWKDTGDSSTRKSGMTLQNVTNALWGVSAAAAVTAAVLAIFTRWKRDKPDRDKRAALDLDGSLDVNVDVAPLPGGASVSLSTRF